MPRKTGGASAKVQRNVSARARRRGVTSTCLRSVDHDPESERLTLEFKKSGARYAYGGVPERRATGLVNASSVGRYFNRYIRNNYPYERLSGRGRRARRKKR